MLLFIDLTNIFFIKNDLHVIRQQKKNYILYGINTLHDLVKATEIYTLQGHSKVTLLVAGLQRNVFRDEMVPPNINS